MESPRILIVDDQVDALQGVSRILKNAGYETFEAINGADCLKMAAEHKPDLILLDVVLPDIDGREVCKSIKANPETADIYVILLSSIRIESDSQAEGLEQGADGYIARPIPNRELLARVKSMLRLKQAGKLRCESAERFRLQFEGHDAVMLLVEPKSGAIVEANTSAANYYGYPRETLSKMTINDIKCLPLEDVLAERQQAKREERKTLVDFLSCLSDADISVLFQVLDVAHQNLIYESTDELLVMDQFMTSLWLAARSRSI
jgi:DNA-binding response OmpR family regulator